MRTKAVVEEDGEDGGGTVEERAQEREKGQRS
jgi:hypothetical protein